MDRVESTERVLGDQMDRTSRHPQLQKTKLEEQVCLAMRRLLLGIVKVEAQTLARVAPRRQRGVI